MAESVKVVDWAARAKHKWPGARITGNGMFGVSRNGNVELVEDFEEFVDKLCAHPANRALYLMELPPVPPPPKPARPVWRNLADMEKDPELKRK